MTNDELAAELAKDLPDMQRDALLVALPIISRIGLELGPGDERETLFRARAILWREVLKHLPVPE